MLRADFASPVSSVSIDLVPHSTNNPGFLKAYNSAGVLLQDLETGQPRYPGFLKMTVTRPATDIAYILAGSQGSLGIGLDHLVVNGVNIGRDYYSIQATVGCPLTFSTSTPGDAPGEFVNTLDPVLAIYDPSGTLVAGNDNGASDGRNARLTYVPAQTGVFNVMVSCPSGVGEYLLSVLDATFSPPLVASIWPSFSAGTLTAGADGLQVTFSNQVVGSNVASNYELRSVGLDGLLGTADDVIVSLGATSDGTTSTLSFAPLTESVYRLTIRDAIVDSSGKKLDGDGDAVAGGNFVRDFVVVPLGDNPSCNLISPAGYTFDVQSGHFGAGQLIQGPSNAFDGLNRLQVGGSDYAPATLTTDLTDVGRTVVTLSQTLAGLIVSREITVPATGSQDFARTVDVFENPSGSDITTTVRIVGNLGSDTATTAFATSSGDTVPDPADQWIGTDDGDGVGGPAIIHYIRGPRVLQPVLVVLTSDNIEWTYNLTVPAGQTVRLASFTIVSTTRADAVAAAGALVTTDGFGGQAAAFLTSAELQSLANFNKWPIAAAGGPYTITEGQELSLDGGASVAADSASGNSIVNYQWDLDNNGTYDLSSTNPLLAVAWSTLASMGITDGPGSRTLGLRVTDSFGLSGSTTVSLSITNAAPTARLSNSGPVNEGSAATVTFAGQHDPSPTDTSAGFHYAYDFDNDGMFDSGDGTYSGSLTAASATVPASYLADGPGSRTVRGRIIDKDDGWADTTTTTTITIVDVPPTANLSGRAYGRPGTAVMLTSSATDPSPVDTAAGFTFAWSVTKDGNPFASGSVPNISFTPDDIGTYVVMLTATDKDATSAPVTETINVILPVTPLVSGVSPSVAGGSLSAGTTSLQIAFNTAVLGNGSVANYQLRSLGEDGLLGTADDAIVAFTVTATDTTATLDFTALTESVYRLTICDTITNLFDTKLDGDGDGTAGGNFVRDFVVVPLGANPSCNLISPAGYTFDIQTGHFGAGQLIQGPSNAFDGLDRLQVGGSNYAPATLTATPSDGGCTIITPAQTLAGLTVSRKITVPSTGGQDFARTIDVFQNTTANPITTTVRVVGNLGSDAATTIFATSSGDTTWNTADQWIGTDDADGAGSPAIIHYVCGPLGLRPTSVVCTDDNVEWTYTITVPAGQTAQLAYFTIVSPTRAGAIAAANALVTSNGFGGQAAAFLSQAELESLLNFSVPPHVITSLLSEGDVLATGNLIYTATFDEDLNAAALDSTDVSLKGTLTGSHAPRSFVYTQATHALTVQFASLPEDAYTLTLLSGDGRFENLAGIDLDGEPHLPFSLPSGDGNPGGDLFIHFSMDQDIGGPVALPMTTAIQPLGSLIYATSGAGTIALSGDTDSFTITMDAGQTVTAVVHPSAPGFQPALVLLDAGGTILGAATATITGDEAVLQTIPIATAGSYTLRVGGMGGTTGSYSLQLILNAAVEMESQGAAANDSPASAHDLDGSVLALGNGSAGRAAVLGNTSSDRELMTNRSFESGDFSGWTHTTSGGTELTPWTVGPAGGGFFFNSAPLSGTYSAYNGFDGDAGLQYDLYQDVTIPAGSSGSQLTTNHRIVTMANGVGTQNRTFQIALRDTSGQLLRTLFTQSISSSPTAQIDLGWQQHVFDVSAYAGQTVRVDFRETIPESYAGPALIELDNVSLKATVVTDDWYRFSLADGQSATLALALQGTGTGGLTLELYDTAGTTRLASGIAATNLAQVIHNFVDSTSDGVPTDYCVRITGRLGVNYSLVVTTGADFDSEPNNTLATAQPIDGVRGVLGYVTAGSTPDVDWYQLHLDAGNGLALQTYTPGDGPGQFANTLAPALELYDPNGVLVASNDNGAPDGRNAMLSFPAIQSGQYSVRVAAAAGHGEYSLQVVRQIFDTSLSAMSVAENQPAGTIVGTLTTIDTNVPASPFAYALVNTETYPDNTAFQIVGSQLVTSASFDFEARPSYTICVRTTDAGGVTFQKPFAISVIDVPESFSAEAADWTDGGLTLKAAGGKLHLYRSGTTIDAIPPHAAGKITGITIAGRAGADDQLTIDLGGGNAIPAGGLVFDGGEGSGGNTLVIKDAAGSNAWGWTSTQLILNGAVLVTRSDVQAYAFDLGSGTLGLGGSTVSGLTLLSGRITNGTLWASSCTLEGGTVSATLGGSGGLTKTGTGTLTLAAPNNYLGNTSVQAGIVVVADANALPSGTSLIIGVNGSVVLQSDLSQAIELSGLTFDTGLRMAETSPPDVAVASSLIAGARSEELSTIGDASNSPPAAVIVAAVNDPPVLVGVEAASLGCGAAGSPASQIAGRITAAGPDNQLTGATIKIASGCKKGQDALVFANTATITGTWNVAKGIVTLRDNNTPAASQAMLRTIDFQNAAAKQTSATRSLSFAVTDGLATSKDACVFDRGGERQSRRHRRNDCVSRCIGVAPPNAVRTKGPADPVCQRAELGCGRISLTRCHELGSAHRALTLVCCVWTARGGSGVGVCRSVASSVRLHASARSPDQDPNSTAQE